MSDLMELVNDCGEASAENGDVQAAIARANELKVLGFDAAAAEIMRRATLKQKLSRIAERKYIVVTDEKIKAFLTRKAQVAGLLGASIWGGGSADISRQIGVSDGSGYTWTWKEVPVREYKAIPPKDVLAKLAEQKALGCFDDFTIASVEKIKDPLLLGRINGVSDKRWYIAQWGDDISLDDVI